MKVKRDLWLVGDEYRLSAVGERFRVEAGDLSVEVAARRVSSIVLDGFGSVTSASLFLASRWRIPVIVLDDELSAVLWTKPFHYVEVVLSQVEALNSPLKNVLARDVLEAYRVNVEEAIRYWLRERFEELKGLSQPEKLLENVYPRFLPSYLYLRKLLVAKVLAEVVKAGLCPSISFLSSGHDSLARDLALEFDGVVPLYVALKLAHEDASLSVSEGEGRRFLAKMLQDRLEEKVASRAGREASVSTWISVQVKSFARALRSRVVGYKPFTWRA